MTRVVVTGGAGFLGSHLCERLLADGAEVVALDNFVTGTPANVAHLLENERFRLIRADVTDYVHVPGPVDAILHFASPASPIDYLLLPIETLKVGSIGTLHALGLAKEKGARFLLASTSETYGDPQVHPQPETYWGHVNPVGPRGVYDEAKRYAEALTMAYNRTHGVDTSIVRIFNSVLADEQVLYDDGTTLRRSTAAEVAERLGGATSSLSGWSVPAFDSQGRIRATEASWFVGHPPIGPCFEIVTRYGRSIRVTGDHSLFVEGESGHPIPKPVSEIVVGDKVAICGRLGVIERDRPVVDLLDMISAQDPWSFVVSFDGLRQAVADNRSDLVGAYAAKRPGRSRQSAGGTVTRWLQSGWVPVGALRACGISIPADTLVRRLQSGRTTLPRMIVLTDDLLWVLGLYVAEGCWAEYPPKSYCVSICCDDATLDRAEKVIERDLGLHCTRALASNARGGLLNVNGRLVLDLLRHLEFSGPCKGLPGWILGLPLRRLGFVIEGYREGDGVHSGDKFAEGVRHEFSTVHESLKDDLIVAFARFGLVPSVGRYKTRLREKTFNFWRLTLCKVAPWGPLDWHFGVEQSLQAQRYGDIVWAPVKARREVPPTDLVYDFAVPGKENFWAGTGLLAHNTHGPRMRPDDGRAIPAFASQALRGRPITVAGDGSQTRSIMYVDDLLEGVLRMLRSDLIGPVNIGNPHEVSILELANAVKRLANSDSEIVFIPRPEDDPSVRQPDIGLARRELGWEPKVDLDEGLTRTLAWFRQHPELVG